LSRRADPGALPGQPREGEEPAFRAPWEAQAFALAVSLHERGVFTWTEWAQTLGAEIARAGPGADGERYYDHWLCALERLLAAKGVVSEEARIARRDAWERAARATPHGQPIVLGNADQPSRPRAGKVSSSQ
jgi:nitrile hydratase accessory protein